MATATEEMQCEVVGCEFVTPPMEPTMAMQRLALHDKQVHSEPTKFRVCAWNNSKEASLSLQQKKGKAEKERGEVESSRYATELGQHMGGWRQKQPQATKSCA